MIKEKSNKRKDRREYQILNTSGVSLAIKQNASNSSTSAEFEVLLCYYSRQIPFSLLFLSPLLCLSLHYLSSTYVMDVD